jgi:hypothetical protein
MKVNLTEDLSTITTIQVTTLNKIIQKITWIIADAVENAVANKEDQVDIDTGVGIIKIKFDNQNVRYKFVPKQVLEETIAKTIVTEQNPLKIALETSLADKMVNVYKDFF